MSSLLQSLIGHRQRTLLFVVLPTVLLASCGGSDSGTTAAPADPDGDGWTAAAGDCCESTSCAANPAAVNPGAFEILNNGTDDDCNISTLDTVAPTLCSTVAQFGAVTPEDMAAAMDLCQSTAAGAAPQDATWGLISAEFLDVRGNALSTADLNAVQDKQTAIMENHGTGGILPRNGTTMAGMSTGWMRDEDDPNYAGYSTAMARDDFTGPTDFLTANGGAYPVKDGCAAGSGSHDAVNLRLTIRVPTNAYALSYDHMYLSSEYKDWSCSNYNDIALALLNSASPQLPTDKNISYDANGKVNNINSTFIDVCGDVSCSQGAGALTGTGLQTTGGATPWLTTTAAVEPGETIVLDLMLFDVTDGSFDSRILYDNFRWVFTDVATPPETMVAN